MKLVDILNLEDRSTWDIAKQCGIKECVLKLPETDFDVTDFSQMLGLYNKFASDDLKPIVIEPMPNYLHEHIKTGDKKRDECIEKVIKMFANLDKLDIRTICFNWMAYVGWTRTNNNILERGGAKVTGFNYKEYEQKGNSIIGYANNKDKIDEKSLWQNYEYFIKAVVPSAEKYNIKLALHPDDPPINDLCGVNRILTSYKNIERAMNVVKSDNLGLTFCQAVYYLMGENIYELVPKIKDKIYFIHFRNVIGNKYDFRETFHDNGEIDMAKMIKIYKENNIDVPIRVDHVPTLVNEDAINAGYGNLGRLYAIGYLKGLLES